MKSSRNILSVCMHSVRASIFSIGLLTLTTVALQAQSIHIGVKAGPNFLKLGGRSFDGKMKAGYSAGAYGEINLNRTWGIQPELMFTQTFASTSDQFNAIYPGGVSSNITLNCITVPVLATYKPVPELSIMLGPQYTYIVNQTEGLLQGSSYPKDAFKKSDLAVVFGAQLNLAKFKLGARYQIGTVNLNAINDSDQWKLNGIQLYLCYRLF